MGMSVRSVVACAIPTAVAVIGFIFFWTRKKNKRDKESSENVKKSVTQNAEAIVHQEDKECDAELTKISIQDLNTGSISEELVIKASDLVNIEAAPVPEIEEMIFCTDIQQNESTIAASFTDDLEFTPVNTTGSSGLLCDFGQVASPVNRNTSVTPVVAELENGVEEAVVVAESESSGEQCTCPSLNCTQSDSLLQNDEKIASHLLSDRKRVDSGLEEFHGDMLNNDNGKGERPDSIELSPRRPLPSESPDDHLNNSDSVSEASEVSNDSGKGTSVAENHQQMNGEVHFYQFAFPSDLCGRLVGKRGKTINEIKDRSGAQITLLRQPFTKDSQICCLEGTETEMQLALELIKKRFPTDRFPRINYDPIDGQHPAQSPVLSPDLMQLKLPAGVSSDVIVSSIVDASHFFIQQPTHPSFPSLERLNQCMLTCYAHDTSVPPLPKPIEGGVICAAPIMNGWYRAQVMTFVEKESSCDVKFLDYGGYSRVPIQDLRQIRSDFMTLPFQAVECCLASVAPLAGEEGFSIEAAAILEDLTQGHMLQCEIVSFDEESGIPFLNLYRMDQDSVVFINREIVNHGVVRWLEPL